MVSGREGMIGATAEALDDFESQGSVFVHGERWSARSQRPVRKGELLRVTAVTGLVLEVVPLATTGQATELNHPRGDFR